MALADILNLGAAPLPRFTSADRAKIEDYQSQAEAYDTAVDKYNTQLEAFKKAYEPYKAKVEAYNAAIGPYKARVDAYNAAVEKWNAGPRTSEYSGPANPGAYSGPASPGEWTGGQPPTAPAALPFTEADVTAFQEEARGRATRASGALGTAYDLLRSPDARLYYGVPKSGTMFDFSFAGTGFAEGGPVYNQYPPAPMYNQPPAGIEAYMPTMYEDGGMVSQGIGSLPEAYYGFGGFIKKIMPSIVKTVSSASSPAPAAAPAAAETLPPIASGPVVAPKKMGFLARALRNARLRKQNALFRQQQAAEQAAKIASMNTPSVAQPAASLAQSIVPAAQSAAAPALGPVIAPVQALSKDEQGLGGLFASLLKRKKLGPFS